MAKCAAGKVAAALYASGAVKTKGQAARLMGLAPAYLSINRRHPEIVRVINNVERQLTPNLSEALRLLAQRAVERLGDLIESPNEYVALRASSDVLDRTPETSKSFKASITSFSLDQHDAQELAKALVAASRVHEQFAEEAKKNFLPQSGDISGAVPSGGDNGAA
jgi:hypothetical protein